MHIVYAYVLKTSSLIIFQFSLDFEKLVQIDWQIFLHSCFLKKEEWFFLHAFCRRRGVFGYLRIAHGLGLL